MDETLNILETIEIFDRSKWQRVHFGDVVQNVNETEPSPAEMGIERFIGLEHIEPGSLHIRYWGNVVEGTTFTRRCRPRQVLFGKRRAYQRKVAVAEFEAVVSGDIYVFAPKNDRLLPELLPFLCMSERFFQHAVGTSAGSLSPRTNWSSLASFEFDLPPLDQQRRIAEILWAVDESICKNEASGKNIERLIDSLRLEQFSHEIGTQRIADCCTKLGSGKTPRGGEKVYVNNGVKFLRSQNIYFDGLRLEDVAYISPEVDNEMKTTRVEKGDVLLNITGASIGRCTIYSISSPANVNQHVCILRAKGDLVLPQFLANYLQSRLGQQMIAVFSTKGNREGLNFQQLGSIPLPLPPLEVQRLFCEHIALAQQACGAIRNRSDRHRRVLRALLNRLQEDQS